MSVFILLTIAKRFHKFCGHFEGLMVHLGSIFYRFQSMINGFIGAITFWRTCHIGCTLTENNSSFWHSNGGHGLHCRIGHYKCSRVGISNIFTSQINNRLAINFTSSPPSSMRASQYTVHWIASTNRFYKGRNNIIVLITSFVIKHQIVLCFFATSLFVSVILSDDSELIEFKNIE